MRSGWDFRFAKCKFSSGNIFLISPKSSEGVSSEQNLNLQSKMVINLSEQHSLITNWIAELRDEEVQKDRMRFRRNLERIGEVAAYEISKTLPFEEKIGRASCRERV